MHHNITNAIKVSALAVVLSFGLSFVYAWTAPTVAAPGGNVAAPINTGATDQVKVGKFTAFDFCIPGGKCLSNAMVAAPTITSFSASPTSVADGGTSYLSWASTGASSCAASGSWSGSKGTSGTSVSTGALAGGTTYTFYLVCTNSSGVASSQWSASVTAATGITYKTCWDNSVIPTTQACPAQPSNPTINSFTASPTTPAPGTATTLSWSTSNATACSGDWVSGGLAANSSSVYSTNTTVHTGTFVLTCSGASGTTPASATVSVTWTVPPLSLGNGCGGGSFVGDLTANNTSHGTFTSNTGTSQTVTLPADVRVFVLQGVGNTAKSGLTSTTAVVPAGPGGGASYAKFGNTWLVVAGGGGGSYYSAGGAGGNFGTKFSDGTFGMVASIGGKGWGKTINNPNPATDGHSGSTGQGGAGGDASTVNYGTSYGGSGGVGPSGSGGNTQYNSWIAYGGYGDGGAGGSYVNVGSAGGGGYGGGGAGGVIYQVSTAMGGGGGGGGYVDPNRGWVCEGGVYFKTDYAGQSITIGSSAGGTGGYAKIIY